MTTPAIAFQYAQVSQVRIARPTNRLEELVAFYRDGLGLCELGRFCDHEGYDGVMLGLPEAHYHLEFTQRRAGSPCPAPSADNLLVLYILDPDELAGLSKRLQSLGHSPLILTTRTGATRVSPSRIQMGGVSCCAASLASNESHH
jgi:hypothetical protein